MQIFELFEKKEQRQIQIFQFVLKKQGKVALTDLSASLDIHRLTILDDIESIKEILNPLANRITFDYDEASDTLQVCSAGDISSIEVYHQFFLKSITRQLLVELLRTERFELDALAIKFAISPSTLSRRIRTLNDSLKAFKIEIRSGRFHGSEMQIRHFYVNFFWNSIPYELLKQEVLTKEVEAMLAKMNQELEIQMEEWAKVRIALWLAISRKRMRAIGSANMTLPPFLQNLILPEEIVKTMHKTLAPFFNRYAFAWNTMEAKMFYLFLVSSFSIDYSSPIWKTIIENSQKNQNLSYHISKHAMAILEKFFEKDRLDPSFRDTFLLRLMQVHLRFLYFKGVIRHIDEPAIHSLSETFFEDLLEEICAALVNETRIHLQQQCMYLLDFEKLYDQYHLLLYDTYRNLQTKLVIAFDFPKDQSSNVMLRERIIGAIDARIPFVKTTLESQEPFDILITSLRRNCYPVSKDRVYVVLNVEYDYDMEKLLAFVEETYRKKVLGQVLKKSQPNKACD